MAEGETLIPRAIIWIIFAIIIIAISAAIIYALVKVPETGLFKSVAEKGLSP